MNPNCPDPNYPEWDEIAQGCKAIAHTVASSGLTPMFVIFSISIAAAIIAVRFFDVR